MSKKLNKYTIPVMGALRKLGRDISESRRRKRVTLELLAERSGISRTTICRIEKGDPSCLIGGYASVLYVLGMIERVSDLADAAHDMSLRQIEEERLPKRVRLPKGTK